jgi:prephenate dehydrogenase
MTISEKLRQIDQTLIHLLSERISLLELSDAPSMHDQLSNYQVLLKQAGVSESTWNTIVIGCMAALTPKTSLQQVIAPRNITVVGGHGIMGKFFTEQLSTAGHNVQVLDFNDWHKADTLLGAADLVLISVPLKATQAVIRKVSQYISPSTLLADVASVKTPMVQAMLDCHPGPVMGLHPMFGAGVKSFSAQKVVTCPGRNAAAFEWLLNLIEAEGGKLITCSPEEHDRMMVAVQAIRHFSTFSLGVFLAEEGIEIDRSLEFASPTYRTEINLISRLFAQDASLCIDIMMASPDRGQAIKRLVETCDRLAGLLNQGNRSALMTEFEVARESFRAESTRAMQESNHTFATLSTFLAANEVESAQSSLALALR